MIPKTLDEFVIWRLTAVNPEETLKCTDADIKRDADNDLGKIKMTDLSKSLKGLMTKGQIVKKGRHYQLPDKRVYSRKSPLPILKLELSEATKQMQARMQSAARLYREQKKRLLQGDEVAW